MSLLASAPNWLVAILLLLLLAAAIEDGWRLQISDWTSGAVAALAFLAIALAGPIAGLWQNFLLFVLVLVIGTAMFARGLMGGGDIKLLAASALWFDLSSGWRLLVSIAVAGAIVAVAVIVLRNLRWSAEARQRVLLLKPREGIAYGIAIALGVALMAYWLRS